MIFTSLTLHNIGVYRGAHSINLLPEPNRPVILIGALNGAGKTTFLEAIQLSLYGRSARYLLRGARSYEDYLRSLINRYVNPREGAAVTLEFTHRSGGTTTNYSVRRTWSAQGNRVREDVAVTRDGLADPLMTERWIEFINTLLPVQIADLFLFDGERIKELADPEKSAEVLKTGVHALLGLDVVDSLDRSLSILDRRIKKDSSTEEEQASIAQAERDMASLESRRQELVSRRAALRNRMDDAEKSAAKANERLRAEGGESAAKRDSLQSEAQERTEEFHAVEAELRELAAGSAPIGLVPDLVAEAQILIDATLAAQQAGNLLSTMKRSERMFTEALLSAGFAPAESKAALKAMRAVVTTISGSRSDSAWHELIATRLPRGGIEINQEDAASLRSALEKSGVVAERLAVAEGRVAAIPASETISHLIESVGIAEARVGALSAEMESLHDELSRIEREIVRTSDRLGSMSTSRLEDTRIIEHVARCREVLASFRTRAATRKLEGLSGRIMKNFKSLLHKQHLVTRVAIDPSSYEFQLYTEDGSRIFAGELSAGERQLMATAILWSLAQASDRDLPVVVDTPLGRLDGSHKHLIVENYFPKASHQVVLLSTDEEVRDRYYKSLEPFISKRYLISNSDIGKTSTFTPGYFDCGAAA
jgi:DNA sulfur modification protein DndD